MNGISIVIITYNRKDELVYTINSLKKQKYEENMEIIVIDQNSKDGTEDVFKSEKYNEIKYIKLNKNYGVAGGRNIGVTNASYENMIFLDDDAHFSSEYAIKEIENIMLNSEMKIFAFRVHDLLGGLFHWPYGNKKKSEYKGRFHVNTFIGCGHAIKKSFFELADGYSNDMFFGFEETELSMKLFSLYNEPIIYIGDIEVIHRVTPTARLDENRRFYYKVRNRLYVIREMHPIGGGIYFLYYIIGYLIRAIMLGTIKEYIEGIKDVMGVKIYKKYRMTYKSFIKYLMM